MRAEKFGGQTPLMWASARRHPAMMQLLISKGADVNARSTDRNYQRHVTAEGRPKSLDSGGLTPLLYAARENCMACVEVLLKNSADIDLPDPDGVSPLLVAIMNANWDMAEAADRRPAPTSTSGTSTARRRCSRRSSCATGSTADAASIDPLNKTNGTGDRQAAPRSRRQSEHAAVLQAGEPAGRDQSHGLHAADPRRQQRRRRDGQAAARDVAPTPRSTWPTGRRRFMP